ncbi:hypothetical protein [Mesoplasma coleopterae]|uniref:hypothetical protein n=1 Tax=Mesoplasma coleopterae TaxID=324078 RepID=UPI000D03CD62|nr:hypothetical protein [Mesoplasma coleopterae]AVN62715.1 hypothetical protein CG000_00085 [Mesoplasma coleopterae]
MRWIRIIFMSTIFASLAFLMYTFSVPWLVFLIQTFTNSDVKETWGQSFELFHKTLEFSLKIFGETNGFYVFQYGSLESNSIFSAICSFSIVYIFITNFFLLLVWGIIFAKIASSDFIDSLIAILKSLVGVVIICTPLSIFMWWIIILFPIAINMSMPTGLAIIVLLVVTIIVDAIIVTLLYNYISWFDDLTSFIIEEGFELLISSFEDLDMSTGDESEFNLGLMCLFQIIVVSVSGFFPLGLLYFDFIDSISLTSIVYLSIVGACCLLDLVIILSTLCDL